jgi:acyl-coenzyme A thioesterase PaaI-like protein
MPQQSLELPHTAGCVACGPGNPKGLHLRLFVDPEIGTIHTHFAPASEHIGFHAMAHGGVLATVMDEVMVWAASWSVRRFCVCAEMSVRFRQKAQVGESLKFSAHVEFRRTRLIGTTAEAVDRAGNVVAEATGKYMPLSPEENREFVRTFINDPATAAAAEIIRRGT